MGLQAAIRLIRRRDSGGLICKLLLLSASIRFCLKVLFLSREQRARETYTKRPDKAKDLADKQWSRSVRRGSGPQRPACAKALIKPRVFVRAAAWCPSHYWVFLQRLRAVGLSNRVSKASALKSRTKGAELTSRHGALPWSFEDRGGSPPSEGSS